MNYRLETSQASENQGNANNHECENVYLYNKDIIYESVAKKKKTHLLWFKESKLSCLQTW